MKWQRPFMLILIEQLTIEHRQIFIRRVLLCVLLQSEIQACRPVMANEQISRVSLDYFKDVVFLTSK